MLLSDPHLMIFSSSIGARLVSMGTMGTMVGVILAWSSTADPAMIGSGK